MNTKARGYAWLTASAAPFLLVACAEADSEAQGEDAAPQATDEPELSAESLVMAQTAWLSVTADGEVFTTYLDPDGRYRDLHEGEVRYSGTWKQNDTRNLCFTPDDGEGSCWTHKSPGLDGMMRATNRAGRAIEVRRVAYEPPSAAEPQPEAEADANASPAQTLSDNTQAPGAGDESSGG